MKLVGFFFHPCGKSYFCQKWRWLWVVSSAVSRSYFVCMREARRWTVVVFGCLSVFARLLGVCQLSVTCWSSVHRLTVVCPLPVACLSGVVRLSVNCKSVDCSRPFVNCCWPFLRVRVGNLSAVNWPTVSFVELFFNFYQQTHCFPPLPGSIIGTPFYVMEYAQGRLFKDPSLPGMSMEERKVCKSYIFWVVFESTQRTKATWLLVLRELPLGRRETLKYWLARKKNKYERVEREPMFSKDGEDYIFM